MTWLFEPGFFLSAQVHTALFIGGVAAILSAVIGVFTVVRGQSFAGHALTDASATGGSGGLLIGISPLLGFAVGAVLGAGAIEAVGGRHSRGRDLATGVVLGASIGLASLFLYLTTTTSATTGATQTILFGSIFVIDPSIRPAVAALGAASMAIVAAIYRPLLLSSVSTELAAAKRVPVRRVHLAYMLALASAVALSSLSIGAILSTALLIGPAATALRCTKRMSRALLTATVLGLAVTWVGILLAYDSADWGSGQDSLPVSVFIVGLIFVAYLVSGLVPSRRSGRARGRPGRPGDATRSESHLFNEEEPCSAES
jgi:zinc/manganese transport system permease protein